MGEGKKRVKRKPLAGLFPFFFLISSVLVFPDSTLGQPIFQDLDQIALTIDFPEDLEQFMEKHFHYATDQNLFGRPDYWQDPEEMLSNRKGDCEDYALFAQAVLSRRGYSTLLLSLYAPENAHTVLVFEKGNFRGIFDLGKLRPLGGGSLAELAGQIEGRWSYLGIMRKEGAAGLIRRKFSSSLARDLPRGDLFTFSQPGQAGTKEAWPG